MRDGSAHKNRRVLVVDDNRAIHDDFRKILSPQATTEAALEATEVALFEEPLNAGPRAHFEIESAYQGQEGVGLIQEALAAGRPYALAFVDVRMPPGWDGVETTLKMWELDPSLQVVLCTAYSDYSWAEMFEKLGHRDGLLILKKPFDTAEALQLAYALTEKWWLHQQSLRKVEGLESQVMERTRELQKTNQTLQRQQSELRVLLDFMPAMVCFKDTENRVLRINQRLADYYGKSIEAIEGKTFSELSPLKAEQLHQDDMEVIRSGVPKLGRVEERLDATGAKRWFQKDKVPVYDPQGAAMGVVVVLQDITERKKVEEELRLQKSELQVLFDLIPAMVWVKDTKNNHLRVNQRAAESVGKRVEEVEGRPCRDVFPLEAEKFYADDLEVIASGLPKMGIMETFCQAGQEHWVQTDKVPYFDQNGQVIGLVVMGQDITERRQAQENLAANEALLRQFIEHAPAAIAMLDLQMRYVQVSERWMHDFHLTGQDIIGRSHYEIFPDVPLRWKEIHQRVLAGAVEWCDEDPFPRADGSVEWLQWEARPWRKAGGEIGGLILFTLVITERKLVEETLRRQQAELKVLFDLMPAMVWFKDTKNNIVRVNHRVAELAGKTVAELEGKSIELVYPQEAAGYYADDLEVIRSGEPKLGIVETLRVEGGREILIQTDKVPVFNQNGEVVGLIVMAQDITERNRIEQALRASQERFFGAFEYAPVGVALSSADGRWIKVNRALCDLVGYSEEELLKLSFQGITPPEDLAPSLENTRRALAGEIRSYQMEKHYIHRRGHLVTVLLNVALVRDDQGVPLFFISQIQDITERKRLELKLVQSQKLETVGRLAGGVAHEFNSILTAIIGQSELLLGDLPANSPLTQNAREISRAAVRAAALTRQLLAYSRKQLLQPESLDLNRVLTTMENVIRPLMGGKVDVRIAATANRPIVKADAGQIEQVIMNLVINAREAMPNGGKLTLETANAFFDQESVGDYPELKPGDYVMLAITDTGAGMSEEVKGRAFEPFFSTKALGEGTGLGLSTCYGIITQSGGHIGVSSELGRGTTFKIYLPQVERPAEVFRAHPVMLDLPHGTETILLVEDDPALREMATNLLRRLGYTVWAASSGVEALNLKQRLENVPIDLLFTDFVMPQMSGQELAERVRAVYPRTKILFTAAYTDKFMVPLGTLERGVALLQKPFTPSALAYKLREVLAGPDPTTEFLGDNFGRGERNEN